MSSVSYWLKGCSNIVYAYCLYKLVERLSPTGSAYQDAHPICSIKMHHAAKNGLQRSMRIGYAKMMGGECGKWIAFSWHTFALTSVSHHALEREGSFLHYQKENTTRLMIT
jgi:hypothetical protein